MIHLDVLESGIALAGQIRKALVLCTFQSRQIRWVCLFEEPESLGEVEREGDGVSLLQFGSLACRHRSQICSQLCCVTLK